MSRPTALLVMRSSAFTDQFGPAELDRLRELADVPDPICVDSLDAPGARDRLREADVLITSWGAPRIDADVLADAPRLKAVLHAAGTVRELVSPQLWERGIQVTSSVDMNAIPVAEFTLAAIIMAGKKAPFLAAAARERRADWYREKTRFGVPSNNDVTVGVIGLSRIGRRVAVLLADLNWRVIVHDPVVDPQQIRDVGAEPVTLDELLEASDVVSVHAPNLPSTRGMIGARELGLMRDHATLVNTARGALVDHDALAAECISGRLNAMLDVTDPEPLPVDSPLRDLPNVMLTPHVAGSQGEETRRMSGHTLDELARLVAGEPLVSAVTQDSLAVIA